MMGEHHSYHQSISAKEAERRLKLCGQDGYLTRYSKSQKSYILSVRRKQIPCDEIEHFGIIVERTGKHKIKGREDEEFDSIGSMLGYYEGHRISPSFPSIGKSYTENEFHKQQAELEKENSRREEEEREIPQKSKRLENQVREIILQESQEQKQHSLEELRKELLATQEKRHQQLYKLVVHQENQTAGQEIQQGRKEKKPHELDSAEQNSKRRQRKCVIS